MSCQNYVEEPLLTPNITRYVLYPIQHKDIWSMYQKHLSTFWTTGELDLAQDYACWKKMSENEKYFLKNILAFFASSDGIVNENLLMNFSTEVQYSEARAFYTVQAMIETIHSETYSLLLRSYVKDVKEQKQLFNALETMPAIKGKCDWTNKWTDATTRSFQERLIAFAAVEGIFFSGSFCAIFWLKKRGMMPGLCFSNELISRDEGLHCDFACLLYNKHIKQRLPEEKVHEIINEACDIEKIFICESLPCNLIGMNASMMSQYIEFCADRLLQALGIPKLYNATNPFDWMELISLQGKTNFFEKRVGEYSLAGIGEEEQKSFTINEEF
mgnify:CR=1 FL=1